MDGMTQLSKNMFQQATVVQTVAQAMDILRQTDNLRSLSSILRSHCSAEDPKTLLVEGLLSANPSANRDSLDKKVRNWLNGRTTTIDKNEALLVSRILGLDLGKTDLFLKQITGEGFHWRDPQDITWGYGIFHDLCCRDIFSLLTRVDQALSGQSNTDTTPDTYTARVREQLDSVLTGSPDELIAFLQQQVASLGSFHNTAYQLFMRYMELLETGGSDDDKKMSVRDILENYLHRQLVPVSKKGEAKNLLSGIQRSVRTNWPDETTLSKISHRELDVPRKALILLFLATDGSESEYEELDEDEDILTKDQIFQNIYTRLNRMLTACGYQKLDPRSPFDWMVLYCICVDDLWDIDQRLDDMLMAMFGNEDQE